jgi:hypothetical protein
VGTYKVPIAIAVRTIKPVRGECPLVDDGGKLTLTVSHCPIVERVKVLVAYLFLKIKRPNVATPEPISTT